MTLMITRNFLGGLDILDILNINLYGAQRLLVQIYSKEKNTTYILIPKRELHI